MRTVLLCLACVAVSGQTCLRSSPYSKPPYEGYDVVLIAGQSNAAGNCAVADPAVLAQYVTTGLPLYSFNTGQSGASTLRYDVNAGRATDPVNSTAWLPGRPDILPLNSSVYPVPFGTCSDFAARFAISYLSILQPGRALLIVKEGHDGTKFHDCSSSWKSGFPTPQTVLFWCWSTSRACNPDPSVPYPALPSTITNSSAAWPSTLSLLTNAMYRVDAAMGHNPNGTVHSTAFAGNRFVGLLWHQGESDWPSMPVATYATCLSELVSKVRARYNASATFVAGTYALEPYTVSSANNYLALLRHRIGQYPPGSWNTWGVDLATVPLFPTTGGGRNGLADAYYDVTTTPFSVQPAQNDTFHNNKVHFSSLGYDTMGARYFRAFTGS